MVGTHHIAQLNIATALAPLDDPLLAEFMAKLDEINQLAERSPGYVWRLKSESGNATDIHAMDNPRTIVNLTVWQSIEALFDFTYVSDHKAVMNRRREWFEKPSGPYMVLWWLPAGHVPGIEEAKARLEYLARHGPSPTAFTFKVRFPSPADMTARADEAFVC
ncbi:MAG: DUF3291 domain-containing protein [Dongiaceae bacterium]